ncbi:unnamed protein product [Debaryomyces tyrocola]|nr:unnamed protein product [Debaryomyces tyrocola]
MILYVDDCSSFKEFTSVILGKLYRPDHGCGKANIIIADLKLYENYYIDGPEPTATVNYINSVGNINVTLVESISELITVLGEHFLVKGGTEHPDLPPIDKDTKIIGLYGIFEHFMKKGDQLMARKLQGNEENDQMTEGLSDAFMDLKDYSAKTVNFICSLMYNLKFYRKYEIYLNEPFEEIEETNNKRPYMPMIWNKQVPNLQPEEDKTCDVAQTDNTFQQEVNRNDEVPVILGPNKRSTELDEANFDVPIPDSHNIGEPNESTDTGSKQVDLVPLGLILSKWAQII